MSILSRTAKLFKLLMGSYSRCCIIYIHVVFNKSFTYKFEQILHAFFFLPHLIHCIFNTIHVCIGPFVFNCLRCDVVVCFVYIGRIVIVYTLFSQVYKQINWYNRIIGRKSCRAQMNGYSAKVKRRWMDHRRTACH